MERLCLFSHCDMSVFKRVILVADSNVAICLYFEDLRSWLTITLKLVCGMVAVVVFVTHVKVLKGVWYCCRG